MAKSLTVRRTISNTKTAEEQTLLIAINYCNLFKTQAEDLIRKGNISYKVEGRTLVVTMVNL